MSPIRLLLSFRSPPAPPGLPTPEVQVPRVGSGDDAAVISGACAAGGELRAALWPVVARDRSVAIEKTIAGVVVAMIAVIFCGARAPRGAGAESGCCHHFGAPGRAGAESRALMLPSFRASPRRLVRSLRELSGRGDDVSVIFRRVPRGDESGTLATSLSR